MALTVADLAHANETLQALVGLPLTDMWRYGEFQKFELGEQKPFVNRKGQAVTRADWGLVVNCKWRIEGPASFILCSDHFDSEQGRQDSHAKEFYHSLRKVPPVVRAVEVRANGELMLSFTNGYSLSMEPIENRDIDDENWRLMPPEEDSRSDLVLWSGYLDWSLSKD